MDSKPNHLIDDGFGNLLEHCGSWYHQNPHEPVPKGMIKSNYGAAVAFWTDNWHGRKYTPNYSTEIKPGLWAQRGGHYE